MDKEILAQELAMRAKEEALLCYDKFSNEDALALGLKIIEKARQRNAAVAMDIEVNGVQLFHYNMPGSNKRHCMWIRRKQNMVQASQCSTLHAMYQLIRDNKDQNRDWHLNDEEYGAIGGGFPIIIKGTGIIGAVACSGLAHTDDHQLLVDSIAEILGVEL